MHRIMKILPLVFACAFLAAPVQGDRAKEAYSAVIDRDGVQKVEMISGSYFFKPNDVIVKVNVPVQIIIKKEPGLIPHNIVLHAPEAGIDFKVDIKKEPVVINFTPTKAGKYSFTCDHRFLFWTHRAKGMEGVLEVVE